ncbi:MAG: hypothetical protein H6659_05770 [Ardenticatenaceae bacterium]|nr:hypothetical protein [Anaerolineales bacterium]MCB8983307.1 hypothetical protein [Ardenticatenaceae bacterium]
MKGKKITVEIPEHMYDDLQRIAQASNWPLEEVLLQSIKVGLPPSLSKVPEAFHEELLGLNALGDLDLMRVADGDWPEPKKQDLMHQKADFVTLRRTYALSLLRWRGHPVPSAYDSYIA